MLKSDLEQIGGVGLIDLGLGQGQPIHWLSNAEIPNPRSEIAWSISSVESQAGRSILEDAIPRSQSDPLRFLHRAVTLEEARKIGQRLLHFAETGM